MDLVERFPEDISDVSPLLAENEPQGPRMDEEMAADDTEEEAFGDADKLFPVLADELAESDFSTRDRHVKRSYAERARMFKLRRNLDQLDSLCRQNQHEVQIVREELNSCQMHLAELEEQREKEEQEMKQCDGGSDMASVLRLMAEHQRLCVELQDGEEQRSHLTQALREHEVALCQAEVELSRHSHLQKKVQLEVQDWEAEQEEKVAHRLQKEREAVQRRDLTEEKERRKLAAAMKEQEASRRKAAEDVRAGRQRASMFLKQTLTRIHQEKAAKEQDSRELMSKRMQALLSLKSSITAIQESLQVKQARDKGYASKRKEKEKSLIERLQLEGNDVTKFMFQQKHLKGFHRTKEEFEKNQRSKRVEIISKLLREEALAEKDKKHSILFFPPIPPAEAKPLGRSTSREKLLPCLKSASTQPSKDLVTLEQHKCYPASDEESNSSRGDSVDLLRIGGAEEEVEWELEENLTQPEFRGLWEETHKVLQDPQDEGGATEHSHLSKMEQKALVPLPRNHQRVMARKKLPGGKEFKGNPFVSKPELITFKDFEVGKSYKKKISLTNVTYSTNYCKLTSISEQLRDFISVRFEPPGPLSPGMACDFLIIFKAMINEDLDGEIQFVSATGHFSVPLKCTTKKCVLAVDHTFLDFGSHVVGETLSRTITLTNRGALGTRFVLAPSADPQPIPSTLDKQVCVGGQDTGSLRLEAESPTHQEVGGAKGQEESRDTCAVTGNQTAPKASSLEGGEAEPLESKQEDVLQSGEFRAGEVTEGEIGPFGCARLDILFTPTLPGEAEMDFDISFSDPSSPSISIRAHGVAMGLPVWVTEPNVDLKICMYDRLYQDCIVVQSRASTALRLTFVVCKELKSHMQVLPKTGFLQAHSSFQAQLKFKPRYSLAKDASEFFDCETGVLVAPVVIQVGGQARPVLLTVHAVITTSDLEFDRTNVDFGHCTIFDSVKSSVRLTNLSLLPQDFGFLGIPKFIDVQPSEGFGTLLPLETLEIDLIFSPEKAGECRFPLTCKSGINRDFRLSCRAVVAHPPLQLSHSLLKFAATAVGDHSTALLYVTNRAEPQGAPQLFQFVPPDDSEISITPTGGQVMPGQRCLVQVSFWPRLSEERVREEAVRLLYRGEHRRHEGGPLSLGAGSNPDSQEDVSDKKGPPVGPKRTSESPARGTTGKGVTKDKSGGVCLPLPKAQSPFQPLKPEDIQEGSEEYNIGKASLLRSCPRHFSRYVVPCFVTSDKHMGLAQGGGLPHSPHNSLHLELHCPAVRPCLVIVSNNGQSTLNFHRVETGQKVVQQVTVQNISQETLELSSSLLDIYGPFVILNALRPLEPGVSHTILLSFTPTQARKYAETVEIRCSRMSLPLSLCGVGVESKVTCLHEGEVLNLGYVLPGESTSQVFTLQNTSSFQARFHVRLQSLSPTKHQGLPEFLTAGSLPVVGTQNYSGLCVFSVSPVEGSIPPGKTQDITVKFQPDHESPFYSDRLSVELMTKQAVCSLRLQGACCRSSAFLCGGEPLTVAKESLARLPPPRHTSAPADSDQSPQPVLLTFEAAAGRGGDVPVVRQLEVGCVHSAQKSVEFRWDGLAELQQSGFTVEPPSGLVTPGTNKTLTVTWAAPNGLEFNRVTHAKAQLSLRGEETEVYSVNLLANIM
ncbi:cilia- and flagella-associated protein 74 isoform X2 [Brienomyrus brachyistius]|uniref:cilia- and flagella-associated protein 74 isoform X2 n=1 Tax=Brienomyrus brachyistius TaxID=42636 RepID=UPI0020B34D81|nr:cilia- and flagella-associated protein 74 isoform X2 [Brienomyrus brachyistius]